MPVSALQHRVSVGAGQNKLHDNIRGSSTTQARSINNPGRYAIPDEIHHLGSSINRVVNSHEERIRLSYQTAPRQSIAAPLLMLLSQVRLADNPVTAAGRTTTFVNEMKHPVSENVEQSDNDNNLLGTLWNSIPPTLSRTGELMLQHDPLRFPETNALPAGEHQNKEKNRFLRYAVFKPKTTTSPSVPDDVKIEKLDFSCIEERQNLSISDVFRQIGKTLNNPVSELAKESQVIHYYNNHHRCPTPEERAHLLSITSAVDKMISIITVLLPDSQPLAVTQRLGGPLFRMIADSIDNQQLNIDDLSEANDQLLALGKSIVDTSPKNSKGQTIESQLRVPEGLSFRNNKLSVNIKGVNEGLTIENGNFFANINGKRRRISYSSENGEWTKTYRYIKTSGDNVFFQHHIGKLLSGSIDKKTVTSTSPNQYGIYTLTSKKSAGAFYAIKIGDKFYRYIPASEKDVSLSGVIKTDNADIKINRFDKKYFIVNEKKKLSVNYSPCRLGRSPGTSCLHLSDGLINKLKENRGNGILERKIKGLKPSENNPGLYESANGAVYLKYDDVYFKLIRLEDGVAGSQFMVTGKKIFGSKKITPVCFSREHGVDYINTPQENMMESAGISKTEAMTHIESSSETQQENIPQEEVEAKNITNETSNFIIKKRVSDECNKILQHWERPETPLNEFEDDVEKLSYLASNMFEDKPVLDDYIEAGNDGVNKYLRYGKDTSTKEYAKEAVELNEVYNELNSYDDFSYRIMTIPHERVESLNVGDVVADKGFSSSSALLRNAKEWINSNYIKKYAGTGDDFILIVYDKDIPKKIAGNHFLIDHILIRPGEKIKIIAKNTINTQGKSVTVIGVVKYDGDMPSSDIYTGQINN